MGNRIRKLRALVIASLSVVLITVMAQPADAAPTNPRSVVCDAYDYYVTTSDTGVFYGLGINFKNGPGGTVTSSIQTGLKISATASGSGSFDISAIIAEAKSTFSISVTAEASISTTWTYSHSITSNKYGWLEFGNWGYHIVWAKWHQATTCEKGKIGSGTSNLPSINTWGYHYWETSS